MTLEFQLKQIDHLLDNLTIDSHIDLKENFLQMHRLKEIADLRFEIRGLMRMCLRDENLIAQAETQLQLLRPRINYLAANPKRISLMTSEDYPTLPCNEPPELED